MIWRGVFTISRASRPVVQGKDDSSPYFVKPVHDAKPRQVKAAGIPLTERFYVCISAGSTTTIPRSPGGGGDISIPRVIAVVMNRGVYAKLVRLSRLLSQGGLLFTLSFCLHRKRSELGRNLSTVAEFSLSLSSASGKIESIEIA